MTYTVMDFPLPPSNNNVYSNSKHGGRFKNSTYKAYEQEVVHWAHKNGIHLQALREWSSRIPNGHAIRLDHMFYFLPHRIVTKAGSPRKNDTFNRIKVLHDVLTDLLGIDDSLVWCGYVDKQPIAVEGLQEGVMLKFSVMNIHEPRGLESELYS